jgi:hypothetical protein
MTVQYILRTGTKGSGDTRLPWHLKFSLWDQVFSRSKYFHNINEEKKTSKFALIMILYAAFSVLKPETFLLELSAVSSLQKYGTGRMAWLII